MSQHDNDAASLVERNLDAGIRAVQQRIKTTVDLLQMQQAIIEHQPDAKVVVDEDGVIVVVNRETEVMFGYPRKEMLGQALEMLLPERFREIHLAHRLRYNAAPQTRPMGFSNVFGLWGRRKSGLEFRVDIMLAPIVIDAGSFTIAAIRRLRDEPTSRRRPPRAPSGEDAPVTTDAHAADAAASVRAAQNEDVRPD